MIVIIVLINETRYRRLHYRTSLYKCSISCITLSASGNTCFPQETLVSYEIPTFSLVRPFFEEGGGGLENFGQKLKFWGFFQLRSPLILLFQPMAASFAHFL